MPFVTAATPPLPLADQVCNAIDRVLEESNASPQVKAEALACACLHVFGAGSARRSWGEDARALAETVKAVGYVADQGIGGPCAIPPNTILGAKPESLQRPLHVVTADRPADSAITPAYDCGPDSDKWSA